MFVLMEILRKGKFSQYLMQFFGLNSRIFYAKRALLAKMYLTMASLIDTASYPVLYSVKKEGHIFLLVIFHHGEKLLTNCF